tara:strand:- start:178 stop:504 length:327 start_codon:yes stop_codon:yes gene_type:complete
MDIKFVLLVIGIFIFTLGYVNQNKYNCNIVPSLNRMQERDLRKLFYNNSAFVDYERDLNLLENTDEKDIVTNRGSRRSPIIVQSDDYLDSINSQSQEYISTSGKYGGR